MNFGWIGNLTENLRLHCASSRRLSVLIQSHIKNICFDAFADKSVAAEKSVELDNKTFGNIIKEENDRINAEEKAGNVAE